MNGREQTAGKAAGIDLRSQGEWEPNPVQADAKVENVEKGCDQFPNEDRGRSHRKQRTRAGVSPGLPREAGTVESEKVGATLPGAGRLDSRQRTLE